MMQAFYVTDPENVIRETGVHVYRINTPVLSTTNEGCR